MSEVYLLNGQLNMIATLVNRGKRWFDDHSYIIDVKLQNYEQLIAVIYLQKAE